MRVTLALFFGFLLISICSCQDKNNDVRIFVSWEGSSYPPGYMWELGMKEPTGVEPKLIKRVLETAGYSYTFIHDYDYNQNGDARIDVITDGEADLSIRSITITEDRKQSVNFSEPYYYDGVSALVLDRSEIKSKDDFQNKRVYVVEFTTAYTWAKENLALSQIVSYNDYPGQAPENLLLEGEIDVYLGDRTFLKTLLIEYPEFNLLDGTYTREPFGIAVAKEQSQLLLDINYAIEELKRSGELEQITSEFRK